MVHRFPAAARGRSLAAERGPPSRRGARASRTSRGGGFSGRGAQAPGRWGSVAVHPGLSCPEAHGIFPDRGPNRCPPHWQADSQHWTAREVPINFYLYICVAELILS